MLTPTVMEPGITDTGTEGQPGHPAIAHSLLCRSSCLFLKMNFLFRLDLGLEKSWGENAGSCPLLPNTRVPR